MAACAGLLPRLAHWRRLLLTHHTSVPNSRCCKLDLPAHPHICAAHDHASRNPDAICYAHCSTYLDIYHIPYLHALRFTHAYDHAYLRYTAGEGTRAFQLPLRSRCTLPL